MPLRSAFALGAVLATAAAAGAGAVPLIAQCPAYCPPEVSLAAHHPDMVGPSAFDGTLAYSTPAYVSMDVPRSVSLFYSSHQAAPYAYVQVDVRTMGAPPQATSLQVVVPSTGVILSPERFYAGGDSAQIVRLAAQWDMGSQPTGSYPVRVIVRNYWNGGAQVQTVSQDTRVLVVNESASRFGAGWTMPGFQRLYQQANQDVIITAGDGSAAYFVQSGCQPLSFNSPYQLCDYTSPRGDFSTLRLNTSTWLYTRTLPDGKKYVFDAAGLLQYVENRFGHRISYAWQTVSGASVPQSVTDPAGKSTLFGYDGNGRLSTITTPGTSTPRQSTISYDLNGGLWRVLEPDGSVALDSLVYNGAGRITGWKVGPAQQWNVTYDPTFSLDSIKAPLIQTNLGSERPTTTIRSLREQTIAPDTATSIANRAPAVTLLSLWVNVTGPASDSTVSSPAGGFNTPARVRDVNGLIGRTWVDSLGRDTLVITPQSDTIRTAYSGPRVTRVAGGREIGTNGLTVFKWSQHFQYGVFDQVTQTAGTGQRTQNYHLGSLGQLDSVTTNIVGEVTRYTYASDWRLASMTDASGLQTTYHRSTTGGMNTDSVRSSGRRVAYTYDQYGRPQQTKNPLNQTASTAYDLLNRTTRVTTPLGDTTTFEHDELGLNEVEDAVGQSYEFHRNALGWTGLAVDPRGQYEWTVYRPTGQVSYTVNRRGGTLIRRYDAQNRLYQVDSAGVPLVQYEYDPNGRWTRISTAASIDTIHTDTAGRVIREATVRDGIHFDVWTLRHHDGRARGFDIRAPSGRVEATYAYESDRISTIVFGDMAGELAYNSVGLVRQVRLRTVGEPDTIHFSYTPEHSLARIRYSPSAVNHAFGVGYDHDLLDRIREAGRALSDSSRSFAYDAAGQLVSVVDSALVPICTWNEILQIEHCINGRDQVGWRSYSYDAVGNRTDGGAVYDTAGNRLVSFDGYSFQYDADGNLTRKHFTSNSTVFDQHLTWNILGQLVAVTTVRPGDTTQVTFGYDGLGRRARKTNVTSGTVTRYIYSGDHVMLEADSAGSTVATYSYYPGVDAPLAMGRGGNTYVYARSANGNIAGLFTPSGQVAAQYRYGPWGELEHEQASVQNPLRYTGREWDPETGLYYYRARYYDPQVGRFVSEDLIGLAGGINPYVYAFNDPVNLRDPSGLNPQQPCPLGLVGELKYLMGRCDPLRLDPVSSELDMGWADRLRTTAREFSGWGTTVIAMAARAFGAGSAPSEVPQCRVVEIWGGGGAVGALALPFGAYGNLSISIGMNSAGQIFFNAVTGGGAAVGTPFIGGGLELGGGYSESAYPTGFSVSYTNVVTANAGLGKAVGVSARESDSSFGASRGVLLGGGFGGFAGVGGERNHIIATAPLLRPSCAN